MRRAVLCAMAALGLGALAQGAIAQTPKSAPPPSSNQTGNEVTLSLAQAQTLAAQALAANRPQLAFSLTEGLLQADPENGQAHYLQALALSRLNKLRPATKSARFAFTSAQTDLQRFEAAELAANLTYADARFTASQIWLRRAVHYAPNDTMRDRSVLAFRKVRHDNPFSLNLSFSLSPSNNVNNGANSPYNIIEGSPLVGTISPAARAIDGWEAKTHARGAIRLVRRETFETALTFDLYDRRVRFNDPVPRLSSSDLTTTRAGLGLRHVWAPETSGRWAATVGGGRVWYGGAPYYDFANLGLSRLQTLGARTRLTLAGQLEDQRDKTGARRDATVASAVTGLSYAFADGATLSGQIQFRDIDSRARNRSSEQWSGLVSFTLGPKVGPAKVSLSLGHSVIAYQRYTVPLLFTGKREDVSWFGGISATFKDWSYMGFIPTLKIDTEQTRSNISRFDVDGTNLSLSIRSEF